MVVMPSSASLRSITWPTPQSLRMGMGARNAASVPGSTTVIPCGLRKSLAILAISLFVPTPNEAESLSSSSTRTWMAAANLPGGP